MMSSRSSRSVKSIQEMSGVQTAISVAAGNKNASMFRSGTQLLILPTLRWHPVVAAAAVLPGLVRDVGNYLDLNVIYRGKISSQGLNERSILWECEVVKY